jgi:hypothetical protein
MMEILANAPPAPLLVREFFGVRYSDTEMTVTSGSPFDLPNDDLGTAEWWPNTNNPVFDHKSDWAESALSFTGTGSAYPNRSYERTAANAMIDPEMSRLEAAAQIDDERAFVAAYKQVDWPRRSAKDFIRGVQLALAVGAYLTARNLAALGAARFPNHVDLQKYARILAPPKALRSKHAVSSNWKANRNWLVQHGESYRGQWVALRDGELVGSANTLKTLSAQLHNTTGLLITKAY